MKRKIQQDSAGLYVKANNRTYRPDTQLVKDTQHTREVRGFLAQINEASQPENLKEQPSEATKGQEVTVSPGDYGVASIDIPLSDDYVEQEQWIAEDVPELSEDTKKKIHADAVTEKKNLTEDASEGAEKKMDFLQSLIKEDENNG